MAVVYLFAADIRLWSMTEKSIYYSGVDFSRIRLRNCSEGLYTLVLCSQRPVLRYRQTYHRQPCDAEVVPPKVIKKCGLYRTMLKVNDAREAVKIPGHQRFEH